jgi:beta-lactam-binding protein with PASTA domain
MFMQVSVKFEPRGDHVAMAENPPRDPRTPTEDETLVVDDWGPETMVVEETEVVEPRRRPPLGLWPWLLALLAVVLGILAAAFLLSRDDNESAAPTTTAATTAQTTTQTTTQVARVAVPDVVGTTSSQATATLREVGLEANVAGVPSDKPAGTVIAQDPKAGDKADKGASVRLNVAQPRQDTTPATTAPKPTTTAPKPTTPAATTGAATTQAPPTTTAPPQPKPATVPDVVGQELADAAQAFGDQGLKISARYVPSNEAAGRVVAQAQPPGTQRTSGDTVQVNVSIGAEPAPPVAVPNATGRRIDAGRSVLEQAGFEVLAINLATGKVTPTDTVASQTPAAGAQIPRGSLVILYVTT